MNRLKNKAEKLKKGLDEQSKVLKNFTDADQDKSKKTRTGTKNKPVKKD